MTDEHEDGVSEPEGEPAGDTSEIEEGDEAGEFPDAVEDEVKPEDI